MVSTTLGPGPTPSVRASPSRERSRPDPASGNFFPGAARPACRHDGGVPIRVLLADDHPVVRRGLAALLGTLDDFEVVGEAEDGEAAVREAQLTRPDVVLMDVRMPGIDGVEATRRIRKAVPDDGGAGAHDVRRGRHRLHRDAGRRAGLPAQGRRAGRDRRRHPGGRPRPGDLRRRHRVPAARALRQPAGRGGVRRPVPGADRRARRRSSSCWRTVGVRRRSPRRCTCPPRRSATTSPRSSPSSRSATGPSR